MKPEVSPGGSIFEIRGMRDTREWTREGKGLVRNGETGRPGRERKEGGPGGREPLAPGICVINLSPSVWLRGESSLWPGWLEQRRLPPGEGRAPGSPSMTFPSTKPGG